MAAWGIPSRLWKLIREVEDLFKLQAQTANALDAVNARLRSLENRLTRLEAAQQLLVAEAKAAAGAAATTIAGAVLSDVVTRVTRVEMRTEAVERRLLPPSA
jgi:two-component sensor histidine kinase